MELPADFWPYFLAAILYGILGIILVVAGFMAFDLINRRIDVQQELAEKQNIAVAIVCSAVILGICYVMAHVLVK